MSAPTIRVRCPSCGVPQTARRGDTGWCLVQHSRGSLSWERRRCEGGAITAADVRAAATEQRAQRLATANGCESRRETIRAEMARRLASIDAEETTARAEVAALDKVLARLERDG